MRINDLILRVVKFQSSQSCLEVKLSQACNSSGPPV